MHVSACLGFFQNRLSAKADTYVKNKPYAKMGSRSQDDPDRDGA